METSNEPAVIVEDIYKSFRLPHEQHSGLKQAIVGLFRRNRKKGYETQRVLEDVSFTVEKGDFFGVVGRNGSGKSTLLKLLAGIYAPDQGLVQVNGSLTPFIELGVGFNPELTGRENVFLNGALLGFSRAEMEAMYDGIVEFAELDNFMDQKLKNYSSGMQVRLAFSIAVRAKSDVLLIDEVLAVGDAAFQEKCFNYFYELRKSDTTVIFISHDRGALERFCTKGVLIDKGKIVEFGKIDKVLNRYNEVVLGQMTVDKEEENSSSGDVELSEIGLYESEKKIKNADFNSKKLTIRTCVTFKDAVENPIVGLTIWKRGVEGNAIYAANNLTEGIGELGRIKQGEKVEYSINIPAFVNNGEYIVEVGVANNSATRFYLQEKNALRFKVYGSPNPHAIMANPANMRLTRK